MKIREIKTELKDEGEDKAMIAVKHEVSARYIDMLLTGQRGLESEKAQAIIDDCEKLARFYKQMRKQKAQLIAA